MLRSMDFFRPDLSKYICVTCTKILRRPTQLQCCGRRVCKTCVQLKCPGCGTQTNEEFEDKHFMRIMDNNEISCYSSLCDWTGKISAYQDHYDAMHMEMSEEHDRGVPEPGFIGTTIQDSNFINSDDFAQVPENENPTPQDEGPSSDSSSSYQSVPDSMFDDDTAALGTVSCHVVPSSAPGAVFEADRPPNVLVCGECGEEFSTFDTYESHRSSCRGSLLHYNGPSYSMPSVRV